MTDPDTFVVASHLSVDPDGATTLEEAFSNRLGEVEDAPGFRHLEVWRDTGTIGSYVMVTWWDTEQDWRDYMGSTAHRRSHARVPGSRTRRGQPPCTATRSSHDDHRPGRDVPGADRQR